MKVSTFLVGCILLVGGIAGLSNPREWTYQATGGRFGTSLGSRTISKTGAIALSAAATVLGIGVLIIAARRKPEEIPISEQDTKDEKS